MTTARKQIVITDFGAVPDGATNNAVAIQKAIDACAAGGGGRVVVPAGGVFVSGKLFLRSRVELHMEHAATLLCSGEIEDVTQGKKPDRPQELACGWICAEDGEDIAITGLGVIDGNGRAYIAADDPYIYKMPDIRPLTFFIAGCKRVNIEGITIRDGAHWTVWLVGCDDVLVSRIRIYNDLKLPNNDGIDIDRCRNVRISDCFIECGDDAICLKTMRRFEKYGHSENIIVHGCTLKSTSTAFCIGCEVSAPIRNVVVDSCIITSSHRGLSINHSFESDVENVLFTNILIETRLFDDRWWGMGEPIYVKSLPWTEYDRVGTVRHVRFQNIRARSENGVLVHGETAERIQDLEFENVHIELAKWSKWPGGRLDLRPCPRKMDGRDEGVVSHPTHGFLLRNATDVTLRNCGVSWSGEVPDYFKGAMEVEGVENLVVEGFRESIKYKG